MKKPMTKLKIVEHQGMFVYRGDSTEIALRVNYLFDLINSHSEAIERLESKVWTADFIEKYRPALENLAKADDTHRTVTLRIPKDMTIGRLLYKLLSKKLHGNMWDWLEGVSDTDLQKALDEVQPNE